MSDETEQEVEFSEGDAAGANLAAAVLQVIPAGALPEIEGLKRVDVPAIWGGYASKVEALEKTALTIAVKDVTDVATMKLARETRLAIKGMRCEAEKRRKELTAGLNAQVNAINEVANKFGAHCDELEERLLEQEKYAERMEAERKSALAAQRGDVLKAIGVNPAFYRLADMGDDEWDALRTTLRNAHEEKLTAQRKAEEERAVQAKRDAEERERIRLENERLRQENERREAEVKAERAANEKERREAEERARKEHASLAAAAAERERKLAGERAAAEAEANRLREAEEARKQAEEAEKARVQAERMAALKAPDREKLRAYAASVRAIEIPTMATATGEDVVELIQAQAEKFAAWVEAKADTL